MAVNYIQVCTQCIIINTSNIFRDEELTTYQYSSKKNQKNNDFFALEYIYTRLLIKMIPNKCVKCTFCLKKKDEIRWNVNFQICKSAKIQYDGTLFSAHFMRKRTKHNI